MSSRSEETAEYDRRWSSGGYGAEFTGYSKNFAVFMRKHVAEFVTNSESGTRPTALDVGCGAGFFSRHLNELGFSVQGIDLSPVAVEQSQKLVPTGQFQTHDLGLPFPFPDNSFDAVWCSEVLEHLFSPLAALQQIQRVLKPGGKAILTVPYHSMPKNIGIALFAFERHYDPEYPHLRFFTRKSLSGIVTKAGLSIIEATKCGSSLGLRDWFVPTNHLFCARK